MVRKMLKLYKIMLKGCERMIYTNFREIDKAGRIVISKDIRRHFNISAGDILQINADDECITIKKAEAKCVFCNASDNLTAFEGKHICHDCLEKLRAR